MIRIINEGKNGKIDAAKEFYKSFSRISEAPADIDGSEVLISVGDSSAKDTYERRHEIENDVIASLKNSGYEYHPNTGEYSNDTTYASVSLGHGAVYVEFKNKFLKYIEVGLSYVGYDGDTYIVGGLSGPLFEIDSLKELKRDYNRLYKAWVKKYPEDDLS